jgi:hypothetical protein
MVKVSLMNKYKFLARQFLYTNFNLQPLFQSAQHFIIKRKDPHLEQDLETDPNLTL